MSNQPMLLDVERDVSRGRKADVKAFKAKIGIFTHSAPFESTTDFPKWTALLLPVNSVGITYRHYGDSDEPMEVISSSCRILEEAEYMVFGHTERDAIKNLCESNKIPCDL